MDFWAGAVGRTDQKILDVFRHDQGDGLSVNDILAHMGLDPEKDKARIRAKVMRLMQKGLVHRVDFGLYELSEQGAALIG